MWSVVGFFSFYPFLFRLVHGFPVPVGSRILSLVFCPRRQIRRGGGGGEEWLVVGGGDDHCPIIAVWRWRCYCVISLPCREGGVEDVEFANY